MACAEADECYQALKLVRRIIRHEDTVMGRSSKTQVSQQDTAPEDTSSRTWPRPDDAAMSLGLS